MPDIPEWVEKRALELAKDDDGYNWFAALCRLIAEHEEPPVDPLLIEARKIAAHHSYERPPADYLSGRVDDVPLMRGILAALKRGIEIGKGEQ